MRFQNPLLYVVYLYNAKTRFAPPFQNRLREVGRVKCLWCVSWGALRPARIAATPRAVWVWYSEMRFCNFATSNVGYLSNAKTLFAPPSPHRRSELLRVKCPWWASPGALQLTPLCASRRQMACGGEHFSKTADSAVLQSSELGRIRLGPPLPNPNPNPNVPHFVPLL